MSLLEEIITRRSRKSFVIKMVPDEIITELLRAAQLAPSCFNNQPARFVVLSGEGCQTLHPALSRGNVWAKEAPVLMALTSKPDLDCQITGRDYFMLGCGLQLENLILQAVHRGLFAHPMAGFKEEIAKEILGIPAEYRVFALIAIGYPDPQDVLEEKGRKPMGEIAFREQWGEPFPK